MSQIPTIASHIEITPGTCGGKPRIAGHRIRVKDVVIWHEHMGESADEIVTKFPQLTHADVYAALAYYFDHRPEIDAELAEDEKYYNEMRKTQPSKLDSKRNSIE
jgi:uncharacterized protein (DUF433 family)